MYKRAVPRVVSGEILITLMADRYEKAPVTLASPGPIDLLVSPNTEAKHE